MARHIAIILLIATLLHGANRPNIVSYASADVIALPLGSTDAGTHHYDDILGDGVTNGGSGTTSTSADDDGGFLRTPSGAYSSSGPVSLP